MLDRPGPLVEVEWLDIFTTEQWQDVDDIKALLAGEPGVLCLEIGYLLALRPDRVVLCTAVSSEQGISGVTVIPRACVKRITRLGTKKPHRN